RREARSKTVGGPQPPGHFPSGLKLLAAEGAVVSAGGQPQGTAHRPRISKLPGAVGQILFGDDIFADVPSPVVAAQNELQLQFALLLLPRSRIRIDQVVLAVVPAHFAQGLVPAIY